MSYGIQVFSPSGVKVFDSLDHVGGAVVEMVSVPANTTVTKDYTLHPGRQGFALPACGAGLISAFQMETASTASGYPSFTFSSMSVVRYYAVFIV